MVNLSFLQKVRNLLTLSTNTRMNCPCDELRQLYTDMLDLHIGTKTNDIVFHKASEGFYETLFDVLHQVKEAMQDSKQAAPINAGEARKESYTILEKVKTLLTKMVEENKDVGVDNVLRGLVDKVSFDCGTARWFTSWEQASNQEPSEKETPAEEKADEAKEDPAEEATETPEEEKAEEAEEDESDNSKWDVSDYWMTVEIVPADEKDIESMSHEELKAHHKEMLKKKEKADESNNKMW